MIAAGSWVWTQQWWDVVRIGACQGLVSAAFVALLLGSLRDRATARFRYMLLLVLFVKTAAPPLPGWGVFPTLWSRMFNAEPAELNPSAAARFEETAGEPTFSPPGDLVADADVAPRSAERRWDWKAAGMGVHFAGAALLLGVMLMSQCRLARRLRKAGVRLSQGGWSRDLDRLQRQLGVPGEVELWLLPDLNSPAAWGVFQRRILLPEWADPFGPEQRAAVLGHELAHLKRRDTWLVWFENIAVACQWWNPLLYAVRRLLRREREQLCDAMALREHVCSPNAYAQTLLDVLAEVRIRQRLRLGTEMVGNGRRLSQRLEAIMSGSIKNADRLGLYGGAALVLAAVLLLPGVPLSPGSDPSQILAAADPPSSPAAQKDKPQKGQKPSPKTEASIPESVQKALRRPVTFDFQRTPLSDVVSFFRQYTGVEFKFDSEGLAKANVAADVPVTIALERVSLASALHLMLHPHGLGFKVDGGKIVITNAEGSADARTQLTTSTTPASLEVEKALLRPVSFRFVDTPLRDVVEFLKEYTSVNVVVDERGLKKVGRSLETPITKTVENKPLAAALEEMLLPHVLRAGIRHEVLYITNIPEPVGLLQQPNLSDDLKKALQRSISCDFVDAPLRDVVGFLSKYTGVAIELDPQGLTRAQLDSDTAVTLKVDQTPLERALTTLLSPLELKAVATADGKSLRITDDGAKDVEPPKPERSDARPSQN